MLTRFLSYLAVLLFLPSMPLFGQSPMPINSGDTAWVLISTALVLLMLPGLAFFYGGLVRKKNFLSILMQCFMCLGIISIQWIVVGFSLCFGEDRGGVIGNLQFLFLHSDSHNIISNIPFYLFVSFQGMFAGLTPALIVGALCERMKFSSFCLFTLLWTTLVYDPIAHWVWGGGFLSSLGALDFAGGTVVHVSAGMASLVLALMLGPRKNYPKHIPSPHNLPFVFLGASLLYFGWIGFNAGSALKADEIAALALLTTHLSACAAGVVWSLIEWIRNKHATLLGFITGVVAGLVAITPSAGFVDPLSAIFIGSIASLICYFFVAYVKPKFGYDDSLDAFGVHGIGGIWGSIATGLFASKAVNPSGNNGLFFGNPKLFVIQSQATLVTALYALIVTWIICLFIKKIMGLRSSEHDERIGLDLAEHQETAYTMID